MDRMPKEFKIIVYFVILDIVFLSLFVFKLFDRFHNLLILFSGISIGLLFTVTLVFFLIKKNFSLILFLVIYVLKSLTLIILIFGLMFFKQAAQILANVINVDKFNFYLLMPMIFKSKLYGVIGLFVLLFWSIFTIFLLTRKELTNFFVTKEHPLVNTQRYTVSLLLIYVISLFAISFIMLF